MPVIDSRSSLYKRDKRLTLYPSSDSTIASSVQASLAQIERRFGIEGLVYLSDAVKSRIHEARSDMFGV